MQFRQSARILALPVALLLTVAACGSSGSESGSNDNGSGSGSSSQSSAGESNSAGGSESGGGSADTSGTSAAGSETGSESCTEPTKLTYRLNWVLDYEQVPYYAAKEKGYYSDQCLDVTISAGKGSGDTATIVGAGKAQIGIADAVSGFQAQAKGVPITGIGVAWKKNVSTVFIRTDALKGKTNPTPKDLYGMTYGAVTAASPYIFWQAFVKEKNLDTSKIKQVSVNAPGYAELASGKVDFIVTFRAVKAHFDTIGVDTTLIPFSEFGQEGYGLAFFANSDWLAKNGDAAQRFLKATAQGMQWSIDHPEEALKMEAKANPSLTKDAKTTESNVNAFKISAKGWGDPYIAFDDAHVKATANILRDGGVLDDPDFDATKHWTTDYVPSQADYENAG